MLNVAIVAGSSRASSQSAKIAHFLLGRLVSLGHSGQVIDLGAKPLPLWPAEHNGPWEEYADILRAADAVIIIAPEWHGMASPAVKNFFIYASKVELGHKPGLLVGVSSGVGGAYPISELRASGYKNCRLCYVPEHLIVRHAEKVLNGAEPAGEDDIRLRARIDYDLDILVKYGNALKPVRESIDMSNPAFANGM